MQYVYTPAILQKQTSKQQNQWRKNLIERGACKGKGTIQFTIKIHEKIQRREKRAVSFKTNMAFQTHFSIHNINLYMYKLKLTRWVMLMPGGGGYSELVWTRVCRLSLETPTHY